MEPLEGWEASHAFPSRLAGGSGEGEGERALPLEGEEEGETDKSGPMHDSELQPFEERVEGVAAAEEGEEESFRGFEGGDGGVASDEAEGVPLPGFAVPGEEEDDFEGESTRVLAPTCMMTANDLVPEEAAYDDVEGEEAAPVAGEEEREDDRGADEEEEERKEASVLACVSPIAALDRDLVREEDMQMAREEEQGDDGDDAEEEAVVLVSASSFAAVDDDDVMGEEAMQMAREEEQDDDGYDDDDDDEEEAPVLASTSSFAVVDDDDVMEGEAKQVVREEEQEYDGDEEEQPPLLVPASFFALSDNDDIMGEEAADADAVGAEVAQDDVVSEEVADDDDAVMGEEGEEDVVGEEVADDDVVVEEGRQMAMEEAADDTMEDLEPAVDAHRRGGGRQKHGRSSAVGEDEKQGEEEALVLVPDTTMAAGDDFVQEEDAQAVAEEEEDEPLVENTRRSGGKRKRGRPPKSQAARAPGRRKDEEEVCFICFDGGDLVVCDRRGCPKVYHPACVNRDESFFRSKGRWNCGWHICSICQKSAHFMCYTCTYSLCKGCIKEAAGFICVRGNKGFCETCLSTVMLIEKNEHANNVAVGVDFDDKSSWMHMFKDYWLDLKGKLSLSFEELDRARTSRKGLNVSGHNEESSDDLYDAKNDQGASSDSSLGLRGGKLPSRKKVKKRPRKNTNEEVSVQEVENEVTSASEDIEWASKELLELVTHMRNGDKSMLSQFDVQNLLLEYIKRNNLRDPRRKSQIICDSMLQNLFGKPRVGHFEMLKLLESHFLIKENSQLVTDDSQGGVVDPDTSQVDAEGHSDASTKMSSEKKRKTRKRFEEREPQTNLDDYAAIDVHNITLMYLRRNLMEDLIDDVDGFDEKLVGSFVRIRISGSGQRQDMYRLVQVTGTRKATDKYKTGKKMTDILLEILNLNKMEVITIDSISNQEFTEEECKRLRQSIKCGLINRLTVAEVQEKARLLQAVRVNDWLENEKSRLGHLRDRASEQGRRKQLRECVEKLQLLSTPEERVRRLNEVPEIHADPNMDPDYESAEDEGEPDDKKGDNYIKPMESSSFKKAREVTSPGKGVSVSSNSWSGSRKCLSNTWDSSRNTPTEGSLDRVDSLRVGDGTSELSPSQGKGMPQTIWASPKGSTGLEAGLWNANQPGTRPAQASGVPPECTSATPSTGVVVPPAITETEKMWHYQDPSGKTQGPFSMTQLRKWNTTGYFPPTLKIWRTSEKPEDSILLMDALNGKFQKDAPQHEPPQSSYTQPTKIAAMIDSRQSNPDGSWKGNNWQGNWRGNNIPTLTDKMLSGGTWNGNQNDATISVPGNNDATKAESWAAQASEWSTSKADAVKSSTGWELSMNTNAWTVQQGHSNPRPTAPFSGNSCRSTPYQGRGGRGGNSGRWHGNQNHGNAWSSNRPKGSWHGAQGYERQQPNWSSPGQQSSGEYWNVQPGNAPSNQWGSDSFNLPTPTTPQPSSVGWTGVQGSSNQFSSTSSVQPMSSGWGTSPRGNETHQTPIGTNESNITTPTTYSITGWVPNSGSIFMPNIAKVAETVNPVQFPELGALQASNLQSKPSEPDMHQDKMTSNNGIATFGGYASVESRDVSGRKQSFGSNCPSPTPRSEQQSENVFSSEHGQEGPSQLNEGKEFPVLQHSEIDSGKKCPEGLDRLTSNKVVSLDGGGSDTAFFTPALTKSDIPTSICSEGGNLQSKRAVSAEDMNKQGILNLMEISTIQSDLSNIAVPVPGLENKPPFPVSSTSMTLTSSLRVSVPDVSGCLSAQQTDDSSEFKSGSDTQVWSPISVPKQEPHGLHLQPAPEENQWQHNQSQKSEPSLPKPDLVNSAGREVPPDMKSNEWSMPSPTPATKPSGCDSAGVTSGNNRNNQFHSSDNSSPQASSEKKASSSSEPAVQSGTGWGVVPQNLNPVAVHAQGNGNLGWGSAIQGNASAGWGTVVPGSLNVAWGIPAQGNANVNVGFVAPAQANTNVNPGWTAPAQGNTNVSLGWVNPTQGNMNVNTSWGALAQGNATLNPSWGTIASGTSNSATITAAQNLNWGASVQASSNANSGWGTGQGTMNQPWDPSAGNPNGWNTQQKQPGDGNSGQGEESFHGNDSGHGGGRHSWNRIPSSGGGGSSRPPRGGQTGICRFHESGYCKKGAHCNYIHL